MGKVWSKTRGLFHNLFTYEQNKEISDLLRNNFSKNHFRRLHLDMIKSFSVWGLFFVFSIISIPLTSYLFSAFPDRGYFFGKIIGFSLFAFFEWFIVMGQAASFSRKTVLHTFLYLLALCLILDIFFIKSFLSANWILILFEEVVFLYLFFGLNYLRGLKPGINFKTEGYMDFGFLNSIYNARSFPPDDMWFQGKKINYYWYGYYLNAYIAQLLRIPIGAMYNIGLSIPLYLSFGMLYSISYYILLTFLHVESVFIPLIPPMIALFGSSPLFYSYILQKIQMKKKCWVIGLRAMIDKTIHEYPTYSFVIGDLRGHHMNVPVGVMIVGLCISQFSAPAISIPKLILIALGLAMSYMTNTSDVAVYGLFFLLTLFFIPNPLFSALIVGMYFIFFSYSFRAHFKPFFSKIQKLTSSSTSLSHTLYMWVYWLFPLELFIIMTINTSFHSFTYITIVVFIFISVLLLLVETVFVTDIHKSRANTFYKLIYPVNIFLPFFSTIVSSWFIKQQGLFSFLFLPYLIVSFSCISYFFLMCYQWFSSVRVSSYIGLNVYHILHLYPEDKDIVEYLYMRKNHIRALVEGSGESFSQTSHISIYTGIPTIVGWKAHEWLWRNNYAEVFKRRKEVQELYEGTNMDGKHAILKKYHVDYIVITPRERKLYPKINESALLLLGRLVIDVNGLRLVRVMI